MITAVFAYKSHMLGSHGGGHIGGHVGFTGLWDIRFGGFSGSGMVGDMCMDTKSVTLSAIFMRLCQFWCICRVVSSAILTAILAAMLDLGGPIIF